MIDFPGLSARFAEVLSEFSAIEIPAGGNGVMVTHPSGVLGVLVAGQLNVVRLEPDAALALGAALMASATINGADPSKAAELLDPRVVRTIETLTDKQILPRSTHSPMVAGHA